MQGFGLRLPAAALAAAMVIAGCGGAASTGAPTTQAPGATGGTATTAPTAGGDLQGRLQGVGTELLAPIFGTSIPTPTCTASGEGVRCRWQAGDGDLLLDAEADPSFETEAAWREAFGTAGFDEEIPGIGVAALGGDNPLADGWRASAYSSDGVAYTVTVNKPGDTAAVKAIVTAILTALVA